MEANFSKTAITGLHPGPHGGGTTQGDTTYVDYGAFFFGLVGLSGNGLVLFVLLRSEILRSRVRNLLVIHQSFIDFMSAVLFIMCFASKAVPNKDFSGAGGYVLCKLLDSEGPLWLFLCLSTSNLMLITLERYLIIVKPALYRTTINQRWVLMTVAGAWFFTTALLGIPLFYTSGVEKGTCYTVGLWPSKELEQCFCVFYILMTFLLPVGMFLGCYSHMLVIMHRRSHLLVKSHYTLDPKTGLAVSFKKRSPPGPKLTRSQINLTKTMVVVSICFMVCWGPSNVHYFLTTFEFLPGLHLYGSMYRYFSYLVFLNSCINPLIYAFKYEDFKTGVKRLCKCCKKKNRQEPINDVTANIDTTLDISSNISS